MSEKTETQLIRVDKNYRKKKFKSDVSIFQRYLGRESTTDNILLTE